MQPRTKPLELFSTFLQFDAGTLRGWISDPRLRRSMQAYLEQLENSDRPEEGWVLFWYQQWRSQTHKLATHHLTAYLQETCYYVAQKLTLNFSGADSLTDFFQIAISRTPNILAGFNPQQGTKLKAYASLAFRNAMTDTLRQRQIADVCTIWGLLTKVSQKRLLDALTHLGHPPLRVQQYILAWRCFSAVYAPGENRSSRQLAKPDAALWQTMADLYNQERSQVLPESTAVSPKDLEEWMTLCGQAVRTYLYPNVVSMSALQPETDERGEWAEAALVPLQTSLLTDLIEQEEGEIRSLQQVDLGRVLLRAVVKLDVPAQRLLKLYYGQGLTQQEMAQQLDMKQYTVSRRLASIRQSLMLALAQWSQTTLHQPIDSDVLHRMGPLLEEWLRTHYESSTNT